VIRCDICKKSVFEADKRIVELDIVKLATQKGFIPSYYIEIQKEGIKYGLPKDRKWKNIINEFSKNTMEICESCYAELPSIGKTEN
jgi:hypothetical protein